MSKSQTKYKIVLGSNRIQKDWEGLKQLFPDKMEECETFLRNNPEDRTRAVGKLKKLRGPLKGILQYDVTKDEYRVWYRVSRGDRKVIIKYAGSHPD